MPKNNTVSLHKDNKFIEIEAVFDTKEVVVEQAPKETYNSSVKLQSLRDAHIQYDGQVTGEHYEWMRAGSIQAVNALDAPYLLEKRIKAQSCCSGSDMPIFQTID